MAKRGQTSAQIPGTLWHRSASWQLGLEGKKVTVAGWKSAVFVRGRSNDELLNPQILWLKICLKKKKKKKKNVLVDLSYKMSSKKITFFFPTRCQYIVKIYMSESILGHDQCLGNGAPQVIVYTVIWLISPPYKYHDFMGWCKSKIFPTIYRTWLEMVGSCFWGKFNPKIVLVSCQLENINPKKVERKKQRSRHTQSGSTSLQSIIGVKKCKKHECVSTGLVPVASVACYGWWKPAIANNDWTFSRVLRCFWTEDIHKIHIKNDQVICIDIKTWPRMKVLVPCCAHFWRPVHPRLQELVRFRRGPLDCSSMATWCCHK